MIRFGRVLISAVSAIVVVAIMVVLLFVVPRRGDVVCAEVCIKVSDFDTHRFLTEAMIETHLKTTGNYPKGKRLSDINLVVMERSLTDLPMVSEAVCYFDNMGRVNVFVTQREPIFRVMSMGRDYYVDVDGNKLPTSRRFSVDVPVVTGTVNDDFALNDLYRFMSYLHGSSRWGSAFTQVYTYPDNEVELVPRVGDFVVVMGPLDRYEQKLDKLDVFLKKVPKYKSWNAYSVVNLKYRNQVVCTKR